MPPVTVTLTDALRREYERLFNTCSIRPERTADIEGTIAKLSAARGRYEAAGAGAIPWFFVAVIHCMEAGLNFTRHLHNGDPLTARTVQVPRGRPRSGSPPFTWEVSAADALSVRGLGRGTDWSLAGTLFQIEAYNGWGYRRQHPQVLSPYLWSFSSHYTRGKYIADGTWSDTAVSKQCGAAVVLRRMAEKGLVSFKDQPTPTSGQPPLITYSMKKPADPVVVQRALDLQAWLNTFPGVFVKLDGVPGEKTSDAFRKVTGRFLPGDPRARRA
jgi:lysozyme family protein